MSQRYSMPPVNLTDYKAKKAEEGALRIVADGHEFVVPPPEMMDDDTYKKFVQLEGSPETIVEQAQMLMGDQYDEFVAAGGTALLLMSMMADAATAQMAEQGVDAGESVASPNS